MYTHATHMQLTHMCVLLLCFIQTLKHYVPLGVILLSIAQYAAVLRNIAQ